MSLNNSNINGHLVPETISLKESEVILTYNTDNNFYSLKENLTVIPESAEEYLDYIVTEGKDIITYDKSSGLIKIKDGVTEGFGIITIKSKFPTKVKAELKIYVTKSQTIEIFNYIYHIDKYGSLFIDDRELKEVGKVKSIEVGIETVYAITLDDRLYAWGYNSSGQVGNDSSKEQTTPYEIKEVGKVKSIEVYNKTVYAITLDNRLYAWGYNGRGQVGNGKSGYKEKQTTPYEVKEVGKVKSIKVGYQTVYAITEDDRLYAWGDNGRGQVGNGKSGYEEEQTTPYEIKEVGKVKSIKVYQYEYAITVYAITEDDRLYAWGDNDDGQVGNGSTDDETTPYELKAVGKVKSVEVYKNKDKLTVYTITEDNRLYAWGKNIQDTPYEFKEIGKIKSFEEKEGNFYLTTIDDRLFTWGKDGKVGNGAIPYEIKEEGAYKWVEEYNGTFYAITEDNRLYAWGNNYFGQVGNGSSKTQTTPYEIKEVGKVKSIEVYKNKDKLTVYTITEDDRLYAWGDNIQNTPYEFKEIGKIKSFEEKEGDFYLSTIDDRLFTWGKDGKVGNGAIPYEIKEEGAYKWVEEYNGTFYAITEDDRLYAWGNNDYGQVGNGSSKPQTTPYEIKELGKVKSIKVYEYEYAITVYAITEDDRLYAWGDNEYGQVGNGKSGDGEEQTTPYEIKEVGKVKSIKVYEYYNYNETLLTIYAITEDDRLYAWGGNHRGQVGNGSTDVQTTPYEIKEVGKVKSIEVYKNKFDLTIYAITEDDRLYALGSNSSGQVGNGKSGDKQKQTTPYEIKDVGKVKSIEVGSRTAYAITFDNRLYAWGNNWYGQVGNGSTDDETTPYEVKEVGKVKSIEVYDYTAYAITEDDRLYAWGYNKYGQVGNGSTNPQTTPYEIKEVGKVKSIEVYKNKDKLTVYTITEDNRLYAWGNNIQNTPYEFKEIGKIKSFEEKAGNFYLTTIDDKLFTWGKDGKVGNGAIPYEIKEEGAYKWVEEYNGTFYAITEDDRLYAWGNNYFGQVGNGSSKTQTTPYEIKELGKVKSIEVYKNKDKLTVYTITEDNRLYAWGKNIQDTPYEFKEIGKIKSFEEKEGNFYLTTIDDRLFTWGEDSKVGNGEIPYEIKEVEAYKWVKEYDGTFYAITEDNRLYAWGNNDYGQIGSFFKVNYDETTPYEVKEIGKVKLIKVYEYEYKYANRLTVYAITLDNRLYAWGYNIQNIPYEFKEIGKIKSFEEKEGNFYLSTIDDRLFTWGKDSKVGNGAIPYEIKEVEAYKWKTEYSGTFYAITEDDRLYAWGKNDYGQIGSFFCVKYDETTPYEIKEVGKVKSIEVGYTVYAITEDNRLYAWGSNYRGQVGNGKSGKYEIQSTPYEIKEVGKVKSIKVYEYYNELTIYAITLDNRLYAWGYNRYGQVGNGKSGKYEIQSTPYEIKEVGKVKSVEVYKNKDKLTVYTITEDNRLYAWGKNIQDTPYEFKEIGKIKSFEEKAGNFYLTTIDDRLFTWGKDGKVGNGEIPYEIKEVEAYKWLEEYNGTFYAITEDNRLYAWGNNEDGQVGNGSSKVQTTPYEIKEVGKVKSIKVYNDTVYAITEDDRLYAWGNNEDGQVGNGKSGDEEKQTTPYEIKEVGKVKSIEVGYTVYAITEDNRLYAWGSNYCGQVGNGSTEEQTTPYEIKEVGKVKSIKVYQYEYAITVYAITEDDRLYAWGFNYRGIVGNGSTEDQTTPYEIKEVGKVKSVKEYSGTVYAITEDNRLYAWGYNSSGQVGNGSDEKQTTPYEIKEVGKVKSIEYESGKIYATTLDDRLYAWGNGKSPIPHEIKEVE